MKIWISVATAGALLCGKAFAFCGFFVAQAGAKLFNKTSRVIVARDGTHTVVTMANDYQGDVKNFALVVPVPTTLKREQIRVVEPDIFERLDAYSAPRLAEYYDSPPCQPPYRAFAKAEQTSAADAREVAVNDDLGVTVEARYTVGEYDIVILSAKESEGLATWLKQNGYHIPDQAQDVLRPYIQNRLKFFVVKVNLEELKLGGYQNLRPIQIEYDDERFMLPIRLGMANADGEQDLVVFALSKNGRIETVNYRTVPVPTNVDVPLSVKSRFGEFYKAVFEKSWLSENKKAVFLEYFWDLSGHNFVKCDPCAADPPSGGDLVAAGAKWVELVAKQDFSGADYQGTVFLTRLHLRYGRKEFPEDLFFVETPDRQNFQARYVLHVPGEGPYDCPEGKRYLKELAARRIREAENLAKLTGWDVSRERKQAAETEKNYVPWIFSRQSDDGPDNPPSFADYLLKAAIAVSVVLAILTLFLVLPAAWKSYIRRSDTLSAD
ncbi:MAG: DUF2330 domain-containing protein [Bacteroidia bacterium]|nr:DUF2330 domain-containing protein [Bacteroidia bacterium]